MAVLIAAIHKMRIAIGFGVFNLIGGIVAVKMIPAPLWFDVVDLVTAYIPTGYLGGKLMAKKIKMQH